MNREYRSSLSSSLPAGWIAISLIFMIFGNSLFIFASFFDDTIGITFSWFNIIMHSIKSCCGLGSYVKSLILKVMFFTKLDNHAFNPRSML